MCDCLLVAERGVKAHDGLFFLAGEHAVLQPRPQVVDPSQPAALAVPLKSCRRSNSQGILAHKSKVNLTNKQTKLIEGLRQLFVCLTQNFHPLNSLPTSHGTLENTDKQAGGIGNWT